jgi:hypothetical protein
MKALVCNRKVKLLIPEIHFKIHKSDFFLYMDGFMDIMYIVKGMNFWRLCRCLDSK